VIKISISIASLFFFFTLFSAGCSSDSHTVHDREIFDPADPAREPVFKQGRLEVYTLFKPQIQYHDFNGVFDLSPQNARIVRKFWKEKFNELTRRDHYGEFFLEFYEYMSSFAQSYPVDNREKELMLVNLEKSFHAFCAVLKIADEFKAFQKEQEAIYEN